MKKIAENITEEYFLNLVEDKLNTLFSSDFPSDLWKPEVLMEAAKYLAASSGGKRARPRLVMLFGMMMEAETDKLADIAVCAELIHAASLLHDDVIDEGTLRRGKPTVNINWGNKVAVLSGDLVLCLALSQLRKHNPIILKKAVELIAAMTRGVMLEVEARVNKDMDPDIWQLIAEYKTGMLFSWCGEAVAYSVNNISVVDSFKKCGKHLGIAFQMADDLKDIMTGDFGKDRFSDLRTANPNFPIIMAFDISSGLKDRVGEAWKKKKISETEIQYLGEAILKTGVANITYERIGQEINTAIDALGQYKEGSAGKKIQEWAITLWKGISKE